MALTCLLLTVLLISPFRCYAFAPKGSASAPMDKKKVAIIGGGGYIGAITFGFLQRAGSLYGTGIDKNCRCIGATSATASALNTILGKHFVLAQADESFIKLTNLESAEAIQKRLEGEGVDAVILGDSMVARNRPVTAGTFETNPNSKTVEVYWDLFRGEQMDATSADIVSSILDNTLEACAKAGIQHLVALSTSDKNDNFVDKVQACGVPYSLLQCADPLTNCKDYTYRKGLQGSFKVAEGLSSSSSGSAIYREDLAALCVQCLQSLDWKQSRILSVQSSGGSLEIYEPSTKRPDQEWCVNSHVLANKLAAIQ